MGYDAPLSKPQQQSFQAMKLSELLGYVKGVLNNALGGYYWITAEVSNISQSAHNGHVYFDLVETQNGIKKAFVRGNLWSGRASQVLPRFYQVTGGPITFGMELMMLVKVDMHLQYGLSLTIYDINPEYTLGHLERLRQETINKLKADGIWDLNRQQYLPSLIQRVAVITSATAAGWGDFQKQISQNPVGRLLKITLFSSMMQGEGTTASIANSLTKIAENLEDFDAVVMIRGGGSKMDLSAFDDYLLCSLVANFPLPIITGIGHEKDLSVADMVAHTPQKTPTAVADFLLRRMELVVTQLFNAESRLEAILTESMEKSSQKLDYLSQRSQLILGQIERKSLLQLSDFSHSLERNLSVRLRLETDRVHSNQLHLEHLLQLHNSKNHQGAQMITYLSQRLTSWLKNLPRKMLETQVQYERIAELHSPQIIMKRGFLPVLKNGEPIQSVHSLQLSDSLKVLLLDGEITTNIQSIEKKEDE